MSGSNSSGAVLAITLARPERRNAITVAMYAALAEAIESASATPSIRVITIHGEGQDFAAGNDLADFLTACAATTRKSRSGACCARLPTCEIADRGRGARQLRRHRHDHAASLRPGDRRRRARASRCRSSILALVPEAASSLLLPATRRPAPRGALSAARASRSESMKRWRSALPATPPLLASLTRR